MRALFLLLLTASCLADTVTMKDGTFLKGRIERIASGVLEMRVPMLGEANLQHLQLAQVESFAVDDVVLVSSGGVVSRGPASAAGGRVASKGGAETSPLDASLELWRDPSLRPAETAGQRQWTMQADADVTAPASSPRWAVGPGSQCSRTSGKSAGKASSVSVSTTFSPTDASGEAAALTRARCQFASGFTDPDSRPSTKQITSEIECRFLADSIVSYSPADLHWLLVTLRAT